MTAQAQQTAAAAERAAAAAANPGPTPEPTPEPAAEPSPAVAGVPSDQELWEVQLKAKSQSRPHIGWQVWSPESEPLIAAHRALYDYGYDQGMKEAKAFWELNKGLHIDLTALQEENAQLKSEAERLKDETHGLGRGLNNAARDLEYYKRHLNGAYCRIKELERELERRGGEVKLEPESEPTPAPEPALRTADGFSCGGCSWFVLRAGDAGHCRKHAPAHNGFPPVFVDGWCGDFIDANDAEPTIPQTPIQ